MTADHITITDHHGNNNVELDVHEGSAGPSVVNAIPFFKKTGKFLYDPAFTSTASCKSEITFIDGDKGMLLHRGIPIEQLAEHSTFMETAYLLINGELPKVNELNRVTDAITNHSMVHEQLKNVFTGFRHDAHPMAVMCATVAAMSAFYHEEMDVRDPDDRLLAMHRMIAKIPTLAAMTYKFTVGQPFIYPDNRLGYAENFLRMCFKVPAEPYDINATMVRAMDKILILHADHEQNASTSTVRLAGSSGANPFACISAGIASLWGPSHGGANEAVLEMLDEIGTADNIPEYIKRAKDKDDPFRLMGFGHRVYKNYDPRAKVLQKSCHEILDELGDADDPRLELAMKLEEMALEDDYFVDRKLYPNVDFYSGIILETMGFPRNMFTVLFAVARTVGWLAQWREMMTDPNLRIGRPRQLYIGKTKRDYTPIEKR